jgi:hypothetical protein
MEVELFMKNSPRITVVLPWTTSMVKQTQRRLASQPDASVMVGASRRGWEITATPQKFLDLGLARESDEASLPLVSRLRQAQLRVLGSRTVHLPGGKQVVEVHLDQPARVVGRVLGLVEDAGRAAAVTFYDRAGVGQTRVFGSIPVTAAAPLPSPGVEPTVEIGLKGGVKEGVLINAIRKIWEDQAEEFTQRFDWDGNDYESFTVQELVSGVLDQFLTDAELRAWNSLDKEGQTELMNKAFPEDKIKDSFARLDRHYWHRERGASRQELQKKIEDERRIDPLDLGVGKAPRLVRQGRRTVSDIWE